MKHKIPFLLWILILTSVLVAGIGAYLKYYILKPLELYQDEHIMAVPFLFICDETAGYMLLGPEEEQTEPPATEPEPSVQAASFEIIETEPETQPPEETEPVIVSVDASWFDDALFIGESRTKGLASYGELGNADFFADVGMNIYRVQSGKYHVNGFKNKITLKTLLKKRTYGKIYINLGINEIMGVRTKFLAKYQELIALIQDLQPDAVIILQGIMIVDREKAATKACFTPESIYELNEQIKALAVGEKMRYIDVNEWIADEEGYLPDGWSRDGTHPTAAGYQEWGQWLRDNAATLGIE